LDGGLRAACHGNEAIRDDILEIGSRRDIFLAVLARRPDRIATTSQQ
jgi:hypothetical protein